MTPNILIVDDERSMCELIHADLALRGITSTWCNSANDAMQRLREQEFDVVLTDIKMPGSSGLQLCEQITASRPDIPVIVMTAFGNMETAIAAIRAGAYDFVTKPVEMELLALTIQRAINQRQLQEQVKRLSAEVRITSRYGELIGESQCIQELYEQLQRVADSESSILITGESGTGKELVARTIHKQSRRADKPFVAINCAALPEALLESELFGHAKGAFTDARSQRKGLFLEADGGTLFLDEVGEMPLSMQVKLLRAIEEGRLRPVGSNEEIKFDVRLLSATNRDLEAAIEDGQFREDLYYRINVIQFDLPPLRSRGTDVLLLAQHFLNLYAARSKKPVTGISESAAALLLAYCWPGNIRELRNVIERAVALARYESLGVDDLPEKIRNFQSKQFLIDSQDPDLLVPLAEVERRYILHVLDSVEGNKSTASRILGLDRKTLYRKLSQYGVQQTD